MGHNEMPLPGEFEVDHALLDQAVRDINRIFRTKGLKMARTLGEYIVTTFFDNRLELTRDAKHATFRALAHRPDLKVSYNTIWYSLATLEQVRILPDHIAEALPITHHRLLLSVRRPEAKLRLARRAVDENMSSRALADEVRRYRAKNGQNGRTGRPPVPAFVKGLSHVRKAMKIATSEGLSEDSFRHFKPEDGLRLADEIDEQIRALRLLQTQIRATVAEVGV